MKQPIRVYLDTSDWSYLENGKSKKTEARLRELGKDYVVFPISFEHFIEVSGLTNGLSQRMSFLRHFPGTMWMDTCAWDLLSFYVSALEQRVESDQFEFTMIPLINTNQWEIEHAIKSIGVIRDIYAMKTKATNLSRYANGMLSKEERKSQRGFLTELFGGDEVFISVIVPLFSPEASTETRKEVFALWKDKDWRCKRMPCLACVAAVEEAIQSNVNYKYQQSDIIDRDHSVYAPIFDLFTCDKRSYEPIRKVIDAANLSTIVIRTNQLDDVVSKIEEKLGF